MLAHTPRGSGGRVSARAVAEADRDMERLQQKLRRAAEYVARAMAKVRGVEKVALFGSVAAPLEREVPRFSPFRQAGVEVLHECKDVDLAVWVSDLGNLKALQRARSGALNELLRDEKLGVAHHQVDVFVLEPGTDRYRGRLCTYGECPKQKVECHVPGCGEPLFLKQHEDFVFYDDALRPDAVVVLFDRAAPAAESPLGGLADSRMQFPAQHPAEEERRLEDVVMSWEEPLRGWELPLVNRSVLLVEPADGYRAWALDERHNVEGAPVVDDISDEGTVYLIPDQIDTPESWLQENYQTIFEHELSGWSTDPDTWPTDRSFQAFQQFFSVRFCSMALDMGDDPIGLDDGF